MITLLRKMRQKLLSENRLSRYLIYAIGEIALVMIGILLALQVNNWNESRKNTALENQYYCRLYEDVLQDGEHIDDLIDQMKERKSDANQLLRLVLKGEFKAREILLQYFKTVRGSSVNFEPNDAAYVDLKSSGNLNLITDIEIKDKLNNYFKRIQPLVETNQQYIDFTSNQYFKLSESSKQVGMIAVQLLSDEIGVPSFKFEEDIVNLLQKYELDVLPKEFHDTYFNLAYNMASNMERRLQLLESIKKEVINTKKALQSKCSENQ